MGAVTLKGAHNKTNVYHISIRTQSKRKLIVGVAQQAKTLNS